MVDILLYYHYASSSSSIWGFLPMINLTFCDLLKCKARWGFSSPFCKISSKWCFTSHETSVKKKVSVKDLGSLKKYRIFWDLSFICLTALSVCFLNFQMFNKDKIFMKMLKTFRKNLISTSLQVSLMLQSPVCSFLRKNCIFVVMIKNLNFFKFSI